MIRLTFVLRRKPEMSRAEFQEYWRNVHGPLVAKSSTALNVLRYVQVHTLDDPINDQLAEARGGMEEPYDGVAEVWWPNREALTSGLDNADGRAAAKELVEDEARFIDLAHSPLWFNYEYPQVNPVPEEIVARESSPLVKIFFCLRHPEHLSLEQAQLYWRTNHGPVIRGVAQGMGMQRYFQVHYYADEPGQPRDRDAALYRPCRSLVQPGRPSHAGQRPGGQAGHGDRGRGRVPLHRFSTFGHVDR